MDCSIDAADVGIAVLQELWNKVAGEAEELVNESKDMVFEKESFREFSKQLNQLNILLETLFAKRVEITSSGLTRLTLDNLHSQLKKGCKIIKEYKTGSQLRRIMKSHSMLKQMHELADEIAETISVLKLGNLDAALNLKSKTEQIVSNLRSIEFQSAATTEAIASEIEKTMQNNDQNRDYTVELLWKIAEAVGVKVNASLVKDELELLEEEKEEMEAQKMQAEAFQLSQLIQYLYSTDLPPRSLEKHSEPQQNYVASLTCPLCNELMTEPVAIVCGHSFERRAIEVHFKQGGTTCPICNQELPSLELTPNLSLQGSIEEWKQKETDMKFQSAISGVSSSDHDILNKAFEDLQSLTKVPCYGAIASEKGLISKLVQFVRPGNTNATAALKCLYHLSCFSDENKEAMVEAEAIHYIVKRFYIGEVDLEALAILLKLSTKETHADKIGNTKNSIQILVSLLQNNPEVSQKAKEVLQNLSWNTHFVTKMAEVGYFQPFIARFTEVPSDARASMAAALLKMQIGDHNIENFEDKQFIRKLVQMLSKSPASRMASIKCIKKLLVYPRMVKLFLADTTISFLIGLISSVNSEEHCKLEVTEVLTSLIGTSQVCDFQQYPDLQELQSVHNITLFKRLAATPDPALKAHFLRLLFVLVCKSETARNLVRSDKDAVADLFSSLRSDQPKVRLQVMKLVYCISENHPAGVPLPASSAKEQAINALVTILTSSPDTKERSTAAGIISNLPANDTIIDEILFRSEALKAIKEVISATDSEHCRIKTSIDSDEALLENALAVLIRYTQPTKPNLQRQVSELELYTSLVRVLSRGSSLAKQRTAIALAHLSQSTNLSIDQGTIISNQTRFFPGLSICCSPSAQKSMCTVHGSACSSRHTFCLIKADAVGPLLHTLSDTQSGAAEAALTALSTLLTGNNSLSHAARAIVDNQGVGAILEVLERGTLSAKDKALDLLQRILEHTDMENAQSKRSESILIHLLTENTLKKKAALVLRQMNILPEQSSYF